MKFILAFFATLFLALPVFAVDINMGDDGKLVFQPSEVTISAGETVHFLNTMLPPHNIIVESRPDLSREALMFNPGETMDITFHTPGDYEFFCAPHREAGMTGTIHVN
tara:strand:- start:2746 stop:3069 length:324 start_codon:yes stop_codon:yes gene_type:complete